MGERGSAFGLGFAILAFFVAATWTLLMAAPWISDVFSLDLTH